MNTYDDLRKMYFISCVITMQVSVSNEKLVQRRVHSAAALTISPQCNEVVLFGGKQSEQLLAPDIADTAVLRFGKIYQSV